MMGFGTAAWVALVLLSAAPAAASEQVTVCGTSVARDATSLTCFGERWQGDLSGLGAKIDLTGIEQLAELKDVTLFRPNGETDLTPLAAVPKLESLTLTSEEKVPFPLAKLPVLPQLKRMTVEGWLDFSGLQDQPTLEQVWLKSAEAVSLAVLKPLSHLKKLWVSAPRRAVTGLDALPAGLVQLDIPNADLSAAPCVSGLTELVALELDKTANLACLGALPKLRSLKIRTSDLSLFATGFASLRALRLSGAPADLSPLARLKQLTFLDLSAPETADFSPLAALTELTWLGLDRNEGLSTLAWAAPLTKLEYLDVSATKVTDIAPLAGMPNLATVKLKDTDVADITPLTGLLKLETVDLSFTKVRSLKALYDHPALSTLGLHMVRVPKAQVARVKRGAAKDLTIEDKSH